MNRFNKGKFKTFPDWPEYEPSKEKLMEHIRKQEQVIVKLGKEVAELKEKVRLQAWREV